MNREGIMNEFLNKKYTFVKSENFEDYLKFIGLGYIQRKIGLALRPVQCLSQNEDGTYRFDFVTSLVSQALIFKPGVEFEEIKPDGIRVRALVTFEGNRMTHIQVEKNGRTSQHVSEFHPEKLIITTTGIGFDKAATRFYKLLS